ncbi:MAG: phage tail tape measure protein, partial [Sinomicrobium sp.]|nr:phage tail tape measure protein [Sinomicrobium sp.]
MADKNFKKTFELDAKDKTTKALMGVSSQFEKVMKPIDRVNNKFREHAWAVSPITKRIDNFGNKMNRFGKQASIAVTLPATAAGTAAVSVASDFELSMKKVSVLSHASGNEFQDLRNLAREIGAETQFSATDAADGMGQLAVAGFKTGQILKA